jgi:serine/threonine protein kinase
MSESTTSSNSCPKCGAVLPSAATAGLCPRCLMAEAMAPTQPGAEPVQGQKTMAPEELAPHFPQLEILECLGRGGMGVVYKARQKTLNRIVALKLLAPERVSDRKFAERFTLEAQALATLNHPNIVTIHDFGQAGGFYFLLMEFVDGVNLRQLLRARIFTPQEALAIVPPLCDALQFAHERGIVHRDIKPENLLLDKAGRVKVADFGIAKMLGSVDGGAAVRGTVAAESATQSTVGTPGYSAPEQKSDPQRVDSRADIYSLGVVFYEMLTGELPGQGFDPPSRKVQIDVRLDEVVLRALEKNPNLRYQQVSEVKTQVETIMGTAETAAAQRERRSSKPAPIAAKVGLAWIILVFAIIASLATWLLMPSHKSSGESRGAGGREEENKSDYVGQVIFPHGDSIEITSVDRSSNWIAVKGHYNLVSQDQATLALYITSTNLSATEAAEQKMQISKGRGDFALMHSHVVPGLPHVAMYADGESFADLYFGTKAEAAAESRLDFRPTWVFSRVIEKTLRINGNECDFLVFRTGEVLRHSFVDVADLRESIPPSAFLQWVKENGVDLGFCFSSNKLYVPLGISLFETGTFQFPYDTVPQGQIPDFRSKGELEAYAAQHGWPQKRPPLVGSLVGVTNIWNDLTAAQLHGQANDDVPAFFLKDKPFAMWLAVTNFMHPVAFSTRDGIEGLFQVTDFTMNPPSINLRYKLVRNASATKTKSAVGSLAIGRAPDVIRLQLSQAESEVARLTRLSDAGVVPTTDLEAAQDKVEVLKAQLDGDDVRVAQARLAAAQRALRRVSELVKMGIVSGAQAEAAQAEVQAREAELKAAQATRSAK